MMNMMTGAVAINGGVGVMEIHQPQVAVSQMAASAAQAAEQVALNAHITLRELKTKIDTVVEKKPLRPLWKRSRWQWHRQW